MLSYYKQYPQPFLKEVDDYLDDIKVHLGLNNLTSVLPLHRKATIPLQEKLKIKLS